MSIGPETLVLLDTNVVLHLARGDTTGQAIEAKFALTARRDRPLISTITEGELLDLAYSRGWGEQKLQALREMLDNFVRVEAGLPEVVEGYAQLYAAATRQGTP